MGCSFSNSKLDFDAKKNILFFKFKLTEQIYFHRCVVRWVDVQYVWMERHLHYHA